jgi:hypothetical protein
MKFLNQLTKIYNKRKIFQPGQILNNELVRPLKTAQNYLFGGWGAKKNYEEENNDCTVFDGYDNHYRTQFKHRPS